MYESYTQFDQRLLSPSNDKLYKIAAVWLQDAMRFEPISMKVLDPNWPLICINRFSALNMLYSGYLQTILFLSVFIHILIPVLPMKMYSLSIFVIIFIYSFREFLVVYSCPFCPRTIIRLSAVLSMQACLVLFQLSFISHQKASFICSLFGPFFLIDLIPQLRLMAKAIIIANISVLPIIITITAIIVLFGCIGHLLFSGHFLGLSYNGNFRDLPNSILSMIYLMTTVNFPDVMMPNYHTTPSIFIFFGAYLMLILLIFSWLLASVYSSYMNFRSRQISTLISHQRTALSFIYDRVAHGPGGIMVKGDFLHLMSYYRPDLRVDYCLVLYELLSNNDLGCITKFSWIHHANSCVDIRIKLTNFNDSSINMRSNPMQIIATSIPVEFTRSFIIVIQIWMLLERLFIPSTKINHDSIDICIRSVQIIFLVELVTKLILFRRSLFRSAIFKFDLMFISISSIGIFRFPMSDYLQLFCVGRIIILWPLAAKTYSLKRVCLIVSSVFALILAIFYVFACIGHLTFMDKTLPTLENIKLLEEVDPNIAQLWISSNYFDLNFNTFSRSLVTLFSLAIVNNWHIITIG